MTTTWDLTIDCASPRQLAEFWRLALGYVDPPPPAGFDSWDAWFVANDVRTPRIRETVERLTAAGATVVAEHEMHDHLDHVVLADPEGNEFCVV